MRFIAPVLLSVAFLNSAVANPSVAPGQVHAPGIEKANATEATAPHVAQQQQQQQHEFMVDNQPVSQEEFWGALIGLIPAVVDLFTGDRR